MSYGYDDNVYYSPEKVGLRTVAELDFSSGSYEFDYTVVWQDVETGDLYYGDDSGCSCPSPFETFARSDLTRATVKDIHAHIKARTSASYGDHAGYSAVLDFMNTVRLAAGKKAKK